jgi:hypothetical protein
MTHRLDFGIVSTELKELIEKLEGQVQDYRHTSMS